MAKPFEFKLAPVLRYREIIEDEMKGRFAHAQQVRNAKINEIEALKAESLAAREAMMDAKSGALDVSMLRNMNRYITGLDVSERQQSGELRAIEGEVEKRRLEFVEARKGVRVMERLKEQQRDEHEYEESREQMRLFDELAGQKMARKQLEETYQRRQNDDVEHEIDDILRSSREERGADEDHAEA